MGRHGNGFLLGDSGYPCKPHLLTPVLNPINSSQEAYNTAHIATRNTVERFFGVLKRRFPCLRNGLRLKLDTTVKVIVACGVLHNICMRIILKKSKMRKKIISFSTNPTTITM
jgi:hypothetical protein